MAKKSVKRGKVKERPKRITADIEAASADIPQMPPPVILAPKIGPSGLPPDFR